ncbi:MAG: glycosyltransferase [candidate division WOR-3 bacterium]
MTRKILLISYYAPPVGVSGVIRITKLAKYLNQLNLTPIILTTKPIAYYHYDYHAVCEIQGIKVYRSETLDLGRILYLVKFPVSPPTAKNASLSLHLNFFLYPDAKRFWIPFAWRLGKKIIEQENPDVILATSPPFSALIVGWKLKREFKIPLITDFRDPWPTGYKLPPKWREKKLRKLRNLIFTVSDQVLVVNKTVKEELNYQDAVILPNGYDPEEFTQSARLLAKKGIVYAGNIVEVLEALIFVAEAIKELSDIKLILLGPCPRDIEFKLREYPNIIYLGTLSHQETISILKGANLLLYISKSNQAVGLKFYEYLGAQKPILALGNYPKEVEDLLKAHSAGMAIPFQKGEIFKAVRDLTSQAETFSPINTHIYSYKNLAQKLKEICESIL